MTVTVAYSLADIRTEFGANFFTGGPQSLSNVVGLGGGAFAVVYASEAGSDDFPGLELYDSPADTNPATISPAIVVPVDLQGEPVITRLANSGNIVVVWKEGDGASKSVLASIFTATGAVVAQEVVIPSFTTNGDPEVAALTNGNFVVAVDDSAASEVYVFVRSPTGGPVASAFVEAGATDPAVAPLTGGRFVVTYVNGGDVNARLYEANGTAVAGVGEIAVGAGDAKTPQVAALKNGGFAVVYDDDSLSSTPGIALKIFDVNGVDQTPAGPIRVDTQPADDELDPEITVLDNGFILVTWSRVFGASDRDIRAACTTRPATPF